METLNLNSNSYTHSELKKLLSLADDYTHHDIIKHKQPSILHTQYTSKTYICTSQIMMMQTFIKTFEFGRLIK